MLIVPEIQTVFILVPRTSTGTLYRTVIETYPRAMLLYRHMEANGVPLGYDHWRRVGFVRHPVMRLWSLWSYMKIWDKINGDRFPSEAIRIKKQAGEDFEEWLLNNEQPWTTPSCLITGQQVWPLMTKTDPAPENKRSQFSYLRPDLGTVIYKFEDIEKTYPEFGLEFNRHHANERPDRIVPHLSNKAKAHIEKFCAWDLKQGCKFI